MVANGDDKPIWMTEMSWRTTSATCSEGAWAGQKAAGVSDEQQATYLSQAYHCLAEDPYVQVGLWFPLTGRRRPSPRAWSAPTDRASPPAAAMRSYIRNGDQLTESCGVFTGPEDHHLLARQPPELHRPAADPTSPPRAAGVFRIRLEIDGKLIRNYDGKTYPSTLAGAITWQGAKHISLGRHTLTFLAYDKERNVSQTTITIVHAAARRQDSRPDARQAPREEARQAPRPQAPPPQAKGH